MFRKLAMCLILMELCGVGCKGKSADECGRATPQQPLIAPLPSTARHRVVRRPDGNVSVISTDGKQVMLIEPDGYRVCEPAAAPADKLTCGPLKQMSDACPECAFDPCPCTNPVCRPGCSNR
jgi:hypothetical protein